MWLGDGGMPFETLHALLVYARGVALSMSCCHINQELEDYEFSSVGIPSVVNA